ncbi:hypothetical protein ACFL3I_12450 [Pseudomonadota bacterium]
MFLEDASSLSEFFGAAEAGDITAQAEIAWMYEMGEGFQQDYAEAANWYRKAAHQGDENARHYLSALFGKRLAVVP